MSETIELVQNLASELQAKHLKIATAESCTGGLLAWLLTELPGSSEWFERGFVTYSDLAKYEMLGVNLKLIDEEGAVSQAVAESMASGALINSAANLALAVTGIAGPDGGSLEKPVGTVWFAWAMPNLPVQSLHCCFQNSSRQEVRHRACEQALEGAIAYLAKFHE